MIAFACVFLLKVAAQHSGQFIEDATVFDMTTKVVQQFRSTAVGKYHLVHLMADGLERMAATKIMSPSTLQHAPLPNGISQSGMHYVADSNNSMPHMTHDNNMYAAGLMGNGFEEDLNLSTTPFLHFDSGNYDFNFSGLAFNM
jgi:hypothetical protein